MDKNAILQAISQALDGMGMSSSDDEYGEGDDMGQGENNVPIWSQLKVGVQDQGRGPIHDKSALFSDAQDMLTSPPKTDAYGMPMPGQDEEMMSALGMV